MLNIDNIIIDISLVQQLFNTQFSEWANLTIIIGVTDE